MATDLPITDPVEISTITRDLDDGDGPGVIQRVQSFPGRRYAHLWTPENVFPSTSGATDGDLLVDPFDLGDFPRGFARDLDVKLASLGSVTLPAIDVIVWQVPIGFSAEDVPLAEGDPFVFVTAGLAVLSFGWPSSSFTPKNRAPFVAYAGPLPRFPVDAGDGPIEPGDNVRWIGFLVAAETFTEDLTAGLRLDGWGEIDLV